MFVRTIGGDIEPGILGFTHCHDHLFVFQTEQTNLPERVLLDDYGKTKEEVLRFRGKGGKTIVDVQPFGAGRYPSYQKKLSEETGIQIIAATGLHKSMFYKPGFWSFDASTGAIADLFLSEIEEGMYDYNPSDPIKKKTSFRAGIIKIATDEGGLNIYYKKVFDAAIIAHKKTGAPIVTHTENPKWGKQQAEYLIDKGIFPESIIVSHMDRVMDIESNLELARLGVFLEYDTIARPKYHSDEDEVLLIKTMVEKGFIHQLLFGMDSTRERFVSYGGRIGLDYIICNFIPLLEERGLKKDQIEKIMIRNPQKALSLKK